MKIFIHLLGEIEIFIFFKKKPFVFFPYKFFKSISFKIFH